MLKKLLEQLKKKKKKEKLMPPLPQLLLKQLKSSKSKNKKSERKLNRKQRKRLNGGQSKKKKRKRKAKRKKFSTERYRRIHSTHLVSRIICNLRRNWFLKQESLLRAGSSSKRNTNQYRWKESDQTISPFTTIMMLVKQTE